jgi:hypothetical protein
MPTLDDLSEESRSRLVHFIVTSALGGGVAPTAVIALYADLAGDDRAVRYADQRFVLRQVPDDWRTVEDRVFDLTDAAWSRGMDLAAAWQRATSVAMRSDDPLEQLARLAGTRSSTSSVQRSIFDDPEDLDELEAEEDGALYTPLLDRLPDLVDLDDAAQDRIRKYAIEERLEHGLAPIELIELYRGFEEAGDERSKQYLDRVFVEHEELPDWLAVQAEAQRVMGLAEMRGRDAGRVFADVLRGSPSMSPLLALRLVAERLEFGDGR